MPYPLAIYMALIPTWRQGEERVMLTYFSGFEFFISIMESFLKFEHICILKCLIIIYLVF